MAYTHVANDCAVRQCSAVEIITELNEKVITSNRAIYITILKLPFEVKDKEILFARIYPLFWLRNWNSPLLRDQYWPVICQGNRDEWIDSPVSF